MIEGHAHAVAAPQRIHQEVVFELARQGGNYLQDKSCRGYVALFDVRLPSSRGEADELIETEVQPDLSVVCDLSKLEEKVAGAHRIG